MSRDLTSALMAAGLGLALTVLVPAPLPAQTGTDPYQAQLDEARQQLHDKHYDKAEHIYQSVLAADPTHPRARSGLCMLMHIRKDPGAEACLLQVTRDNPDFQLAYFLLGRIYEDQGNREQAKAAYQQYVKLGPVPPDPALRIKLRQFGVL